MKNPNEKILVSLHYGNEGDKNDPWGFIEYYAKELKITLHVGMSIWLKIIDRIVMKVNNENDTEIIKMFEKIVGRSIDKIEAEENNDCFVENPDHLIYGGP